MGRVVVLGSYNADLVARVERFPRPGETLPAHGLMHCHGGKGSNQAVAARRAGAAVTFAGAVGSDEAGQNAQELWRREGIATVVAQAREAPTGLAMILVDDRGENQIVVVAGANAEPDAGLAQRAAAAMGAGDLAVAQLETPIAATVAFFAAARGQGAATVLNAAPARPLAASLLAATAILVVNAHEARVAAQADDRASPPQLARTLAARVGQACVITLGGEGALLASREGALLHQPAPRVVAVDTTGAGDACVGAFAAALAAGATPAAALADGVAAGSLACTRAGAVDSLPTRAAIAALRADLPPARSLG
jgi:ribokinase